MKTVSIFFVLVTALVSCSTVSRLPTIQQSSYNTSVEGKDEFIEMKDGTIIEGKIENLVWREELPMIQSSKFSVNGTPHRAKEINAIQSKNRYFRRTVYNDFGERIIKGKINVYVFNKPAFGRNGGTYTVALYYLQKGDKANLDEYDTRLMEKNIGDNPAAVSKFNDYKKMSGSEKRKYEAGFLADVINTYNKS